jgi:hypothetical protein
MALNGSGPISLAGSTAGQSIALELGLSATGQISLNDAAVRTLAEVPSGAIIMPTNFYGKANEYAFSISTNQVNANLRSLAVSAGWNQSTKLIATINGGVYVYSNSTGTPGLTINGSFPNGVTLINNGYILGMGGNGGSGASTPSTGSGDGGSSGGLALLVQSAVTINNASGIIGGGGGGGGGGGQISEGGKGCPGAYGWAAGGGGGGQTGLSNTSGGGAGGGTFGQRSRVPQNGSGGTVNGAGGGGIGGAAPNAGFFAGSGGSGGSWGSNGSTGEAGSANNGCRTFGGGGGSAGGAISGNSNITYISTGTRYGGIS